MKKLLFVSLLFCASFLYSSFAETEANTLVVGIEPGASRKIIITKPEQTNGVLILKVKNENGQDVLRTIVFSEDDTEIVIEIPDDFDYEQVILTFVPENSNVVLQIADVKIVNQETPAPTTEPSVASSAQPVDLSAGSQTETTQTTVTETTIQQLPPAIPQQDTNLSR